jgi:hypothetical protein
MTRTLCVGLIAAASVLFGQIDSNSITITASRSVYLQPDQIVFSLSVISPSNATLDDIVAALQGSGVTAANSSGSYVSLGDPNLPVQTQLTWFFALPAPLSHLKDMVAFLTTLQQTIAQKNAGLSLTFSVQGTQVSPQSQEAQQCPVTDLVSDARTQAQNLAAASGLTLGPILAISNGPSAANALGGSLVLNTFLLGIPTSFGRISITNPFITTSTFTTTLPAFTTPALNCSVTVKFTLLRYQ